MSEESRVRGLEKLRVKHGVAQMPHRNKKNTQNGEDRNWGVAEMQHSFFVALYSVSSRHSVTQYLVCKKTNNFNDLTVKNRLTAVVRPLHHVASSVRRHKWKKGQSSAHPLSIDLIFLASLLC